MRVSTDPTFHINSTSHVDPIHSIDWKIILERASCLATSDLAKLELENLQPLDSASAALKSFAKIEEATHILRAQPSPQARPSMESLDLYRTWSQRLAKKAVLKTLELKDIRYFCIEVIALKDTLTPHSGPWVDERKSTLMNAEEPLSAIDHIMLSDGSLRTDASEKLYKLHRERSELTKNIQKTLDRTVKAHQMEPLLQDKYVTNREGRWVLPIKSGMQHSFDGIIHASSQSQKTVFMEPNEIIPINNRLKQVDSEMEEEIERLLFELSSYLHGLFSQFEITQSSLLDSDITFAKAQLSLSIKANACRFSQGHCCVNQLRHPLLELDGGQVIPNTIHLDRERRILLLSGPNAGGKTVLLKSFGLAAQMARCGLPIAADSDSEIPFFKEIFVSVGDAQSVGAHLSTFAAHLKLLDEATRAKGAEHLVLVDEICSSTDPEEGSALARSFIHKFAEQKCFAIITSHLGHLKKGWDMGSGVVNGSLEFSAGQGPTYQFFMGVPGQSLAIQTAQQVGIDPIITDRAMEFISPEYKKYQRDINDVGVLKEQLQQAKKELDQERKTLQHQRRKYERLVDKFKNERDQMLEQTQTRAERKVDKLIQQAKVDNVFRKHTELQKMKRKLPTVVKAKSGGNKDIQSAKNIQSAEDFIKNYPPGSKVHVSTIQKEAIVQGYPNSRGEIPILSHSMRLMVPWHNLCSPKDSSTQSPPKQTPKDSGTPLSGGYRTIDLRGQTVSDAIEQIERQLDSASLNQEGRVKIIHGHGTETLKRSVRSYLSRCVYVKKWNVGTTHQGGDGVTWVLLKED